MCKKFWLFEPFSGGKQKNHRFSQIFFFNPCKSVKSVVTYKGEFIIPLNVSMSQSSLIGKKQQSCYRIKILNTPDIKYDSFYIWKA